MKILQVITKNELGGAQTVVAHLANDLCQEHEVIVASGEGDGKFFEMLDPRIESVNVRHLIRRISLKDDLLALFELRRLRKKYNPDIVHLHSTKAGLLGRIVFPRKKIVYTVHGFDSVRVAYRPLLPVEKIMQYFCSAIVGVSNYDIHNMLAEGIRKNVRCIYNGIPVGTANIDCSLDDNIRKYTKKVLCIARLAKPKRWDIFMATAKLLPDVAFLWVGNQEPVVEHPDNVFFLGNIVNASKYNSLVDLFILPSDFEGLPMVIIEAMSYGKPIVASNVGGISEIVRDNYNGYVVNNSSDEFANRISEILENDNLKYIFSERSRDIFKSELTVNKMVDNYLKIYKSL